MEKLKQSYLAVIRRGFPEIEFERSALITKGWDHDVIILDEDLVFRFPKQRSYVESFKSELKLLRYLKPKSNLPVPDYRFIPVDQSFGGYKLIKGVELLPDVFRSLGEVDIDHIAVQLAKFLSTLHETPVAIANEWGFGEALGGCRWGRNHTSKIYLGLKSVLFPILPRPETAWITHQFERYLLLSCETDLSIIHGDLSGEHIYFDSGKKVITGVIDFADIEISDPAFDFAGLWHFGEDFVVNVLHHYTGKIDQDFFERSKFPGLVHMLENMLVLKRGEAQGETYTIPEPYEVFYGQLMGAMKSGVSM